MASRALKRGIASLFALVIGFSIGLLALGYTPVLAAICPPCFGFEKVEDGLYVETREGGFGAEMARRFALAETRVEAGLGEIGKRPRALVCLTQTCNDVMGGIPARAMTYGTQIFYLGPSGHDTEIIAHELAHIVIHRRLGYGALRQFPAWVNEGMATYVSRDPRFDLNPDTCEMRGLDLPLTAREWRHSAGAVNAELYAEAACFVAKWVKTHPITGVEGLFTAHLIGPA